MYDDTGIMLPGEWELVRVGEPMWDVRCGDGPEVSEKSRMVMVSVSGPNEDEEV
jgi:hypothetical protein